ncbi:MAG: UDP-N-acetylglucosamine 2-epimerase (non-hydrolyzing) [Candidatus Neomarinimicrobiota bacterium]
MKILTVIGARPQFIKAAPFSKAIRQYFNEVIVHTGQHYDENMSNIFFNEMGIPKPDYNLEIGSGRHGKQTGEMLIALEEVMLKEKPDYVVVFGDTNSTIAAALAAAKLHIPIGHIEAGLRSFNRNMPEEINRIATDVLSSQLFCPTDHAVELLKHEGIVKEVYQCGDIMYDAMLHFLPIAEEKSTIFNNLNLQPSLYELRQAGNLNLNLNLNLKSNDYYLFTMHRPENTDHPERIKSIFKGLEACNKPIIYPVHPRMRSVLEKPEIKEYVNKVSNLHIIDPVGYLDMIQLEKHAKKIITDSGGMQKEAFFVKTPCITIRDESEWVETVDLGYNIIVGADTAKIQDAIENFNPKHDVNNPYGKGDSAKIMTQKIVSYLNVKK